MNTVDFVTGITANLAKSTGTGAGGAFIKLNPTSEKPPVMWVTPQEWSQGLLGYTETLRGPEGTGSVGTQRSSAVTGTPTMVKYIRRALVALLCAIAAKAPAQAEAQSIPARLIVEWSNFLVTFARCVFSNPLQTTGVGATATGMTIAEGSSLRYMLDAAVSVAMDSDIAANVEEFNSRAAILAEALELPEFRDLNAREMSLLAKMDESRELAAYYAMIVYMAGRALNDKTDDAVRARRPMNLCDKFNGKVTWATVGGELTMSAGAYTMLARVWGMNPTVRMGLLVPLIGLEEGTAGITGNIIYTIFKMLKYAGMAHVDIINTFLSRYPYVIKMAELQGELRTLHNHTEALLAVDPHLRPYYKLLYSDGTKLFDSKLFRRLTILATEILSENDDNVGGYAHGEDENLVQRFKDLRYIEEPTYGRRIRQLGGGQGVAAGIVIDAQAPEYETIPDAPLIEGDAPTEFGSPLSVATQLPVYEPSNTGVIQSDEFVS